MQHRPDLEKRGTGVVGNLTPTQEKKLTEFREHLHKQNLLHDGDSIGSSDSVLLRFLRARKFNLQQSTLMWKNCIEWRNNTIPGKNIDQLYEEVNPFAFPQKDVIFKYWMYFHKQDNYGRPLNIQTLGSFDVPKLYKAVDPDWHWKTVVVNCEALPREVLPACSEESGHLVDSAYCIVDLKGFSLGQFWQMKTLAQRCFGISQDYFPETMGKLAIVNAPSSFTMIWRVVKGWLAKETQRKIEILGTDYAKSLLAEIPAENLPRFLGGQCNCKEGCDMSSAGPWLDWRERRLQKEGHAENADEKKPESEDLPAAGRENTASAAQNEGDNKRVNGDTAVAGVVPPQPTEAASERQDSTVEGRATVQTPSIVGPTVSADSSVQKEPQVNGQATEAETSEASVDRNTSEQKTLNGQSERHAEIHPTNQTDTKQNAQEGLSPLAGTGLGEVAPQQPPQPAEMSRQPSAISMPANLAQMSDSKQLPAQTPFVEAPTFDLEVAKTARDDDLLERA